MLLAMLWGQWTARSHAVEHAQPAVLGQARGDGAGAAADPAGHDAAQEGPHGAAGQLQPHDHDSWGHESGAPVCQLIDQLLAAQADGGPIPSTPCVPAADLPARVEPPHLALSPVLWAYEARGPPRA